VDFLAVIGGTTQNYALSMSPSDGTCFYQIEPGTHDIQVTVWDPVETFIAFDDFPVEQGVIYFEDLDEDELPSPWEILKLVPVHQPGAYQVTSVQCTG
jgi:hypothetical protein